MKKAMILAAGRGERMRPLTDHTPKPLLSVGGQPLIVWHLKALAAAGFREVTINTAHLAQRLHQELGDGRQWGLSIRFSDEPVGALETAGGIATARPWDDQDQAPFLVVNGDVFSDWDFGLTESLAATMTQAGQLACLVLVPNPPHHPSGDFCLAESVPGPSAKSTPLRRLARAQSAAQPAYTYSGIGLFHPRLFAKTAPGERAALAPLLFEAAEHQQLCGLIHTGQWTDVGTPQRLADLDQALRSQRD
jgi:MurNAc alpha-1-phosphate uridylyltransferase